MFIGEFWKAEDIEIDEIMKGIFKFLNYNKELSMISSHSLL
jgi:hypothetical protein